MEVDHGSDRAWSMGNANLLTWMIKLSGTKNKHGIVPFFRDIRYGKMSKKKPFSLVLSNGGAEANLPQTNLEQKWDCFN